MFEYVYSKILKLNKLCKDVQQAGEYNSQATFKRQIYRMWGMNKYLWQK